MNFSIAVHVVSLNDDGNELTRISAKKFVSIRVNSLQNYANQTHAHRMPDKVDNVIVKANRKEIVNC